MYLSILILFFILSLNNNKTIESITIIFYLFYLILFVFVLHYILQTKYDLYTNILIVPEVC